MTQRNQNLKNQHTQNVPIQQLDSETLKKLIDQQGQKVQLELQRLELEKMKLGHNAKLAEKSLEHQSLYLNNQPQEHRKTITRLGYILGGILLMFLVFIGFLVYTGNKDFADTFLKFISYVATSVFSYLIGRSTRSASKQTESGKEIIEDANVIEDN